jgi:Fe-S-cluster containining protein
VLSIAGAKLRLQMSVPTSPTSPGALLPLFRTLTDAVVTIAIEQVRSAGREVSCRKGCTACCFQLVPVAAIEARRMLELVEAMPPRQRDSVRQRFHSATSRLKSAGILDRLNARSASAEEMVALALDYFALKLACPFLEDGACSIYADRPLACREYLVTTPAANCSRPSPESVSPVPMPVRVSRLVRGLDSLSAEAEPWVPLPLVCAWAGTHPEPRPRVPGTALVQELLARMTGRSIPDPPIAGAGVDGACVTGASVADASVAAEPIAAEPVADPIPPTRGAS